MQLEHSFHLEFGPEQVWRALTDLGSVAAHVPGAKVSSSSTDRVDGALKLKLGPMNLNYKGSATLTERDDEARRAVIEASGTDSRNGTAGARTVARVLDRAGGATVEVDSEVTLTGKPAQFGATIMQEVGAKLIAQFAAGVAAALAGTEADASPVEVSPIADAARSGPAEPTTAEPATAELATAAPTVPAPAEPEPAEPEVPAGPAPRTARAVSTTLSAVRTAGGAAAPPGVDEGVAMLANRARPLVVKGIAPVALAGVVAAIAISRRRGR